jgi:hypothetical protein
MNILILRTLLKLGLAALYFALPFIAGQPLEIAGVGAQVVVIEATLTETDSAQGIAREIAGSDSAPAESPPLDVVATPKRSSMRWRLTLTVAVLGR